MKAQKDSPPTRLRVSSTALILLASFVAGGGAAGESGDEERRCCFRHRAHPGVCEVVPAADESCADVLAWLNDPNSTGKTYCNNTPLRGGWVRVECEPDRSSETGNIP